MFLACAFLRVKFNVSASEVTDLSTSAVTVGVDKEKKVRPLEGLGWMPGEWGWQPISDTVEPDAVASSFVLVSWSEGVVISQTPLNGSLQLATLCEGASEPPLLLQAAKQAKTAPGYVWFTGHRLFYTQLFRGCSSAAYPPRPPADPRQRSSAGPALRPHRGRAPKKPRQHADDVGPKPSATRKTTMTKRKRRRKT